MTNRLLKTATVAVSLIFCLWTDLWPGNGSGMVDTVHTIERLKSHVETLTRDIGERSVSLPQNLLNTQAYIESVYRSMGIPVHTEPYVYGKMTVSNVVATVSVGQAPKKTYVLGAHYDSVAGTVGADDNASAVAVQLETARQLALLSESAHGDLTVLFVSFALEEPPVYGTRHMGSRVYAKKAKKANLKIDGMLCLEMVGYTCRRPGCQAYPFPLMFLDYPSEGDFIGIVGNVSSRRLRRSVVGAFQTNTDLSVISLTVPFNGWLMPAIRLSDHASFWDQGYRAVMITDSAFYRNPHYHMPTDTLETLDYGFMAELVESLILFFTAEGRMGQLNAK